MASAGAVRGLAGAIAVLLVLGLAQLPGRGGAGGVAPVVRGPVAGAGGDAEPAAGVHPQPPAEGDAEPATGVHPQPPAEAEPGAAEPGASTGVHPQPPAPGPERDVLVIPYRVEVRSPDPALAGAPAFIDAVLADPRGWSAADIAFVPDDAAPHVIVLAEGEDAQALCLPYDVGGRFSCQNGPLVVLNAIRWREGVDHWPGTLEEYRTMLVNHEVGHLIGMHHLRCGGPGQVAPVMEQQSGTLRGCLANPWPTEIELRLAATHQFRIAPPPADVPHPP